MLVMNNYRFDNDQFSKDLAEISKFFWEFTKSFGPSQKKIVDRPIGILEEINIRFRLGLVEMGISKIIRMVIAIIVGLIVYFVLFRHAGPFFKILIGGAFLSYYIWLMVPHLATEGKLDAGKIVGEPVDMLSGYMIKFHNNRVDGQAFLSQKMSEISQDVKEIFTPKKAE
jgi:hypothetical protein